MTEKSGEPDPSKTDWQKYHENAKSAADSKELEPLWACVARHVSYWSDIETIQSEIIAATTTTDQASVAYILDNAKLTPAGRSALFRKCVARVARPIEKKLILDVWKRQVAPVGALRRRFVHWTWQSVSLEVGSGIPDLWPCLILRPPYTFLEGRAKAGARGVHRRQGGKYTIREWEGVYDKKKLDAVVEEAWRAAMRAEFIMACVDSVLADGKLPSQQYRSLQERRDRQLLPCHKKLLEFHPQSAGEDDPE